MTFSLRFLFLHIDIYLPPRGGDMIDMEHVALTTATQVVNQAMHDAFCEECSDDE